MIDQRLVKKMAQEIVRNDMLSKIAEDIVNKTKKVSVSKTFSTILRPEDFTSKKCF